MEQIKKLKKLTLNQETLRSLLDDQSDFDNMGTTRCTANKSVCFPACTPA